MNFNIKKAQGLSLQTIVIAVLVLMVMIVLIVIFSSKTQPISEMYSKCDSVDGSMIVSTEDCSDKTNGQKPYVHPLYKAEKEDGTKEKCCVAEFI